MIGLDVDLALLPEFEHSEKVEDTEKGLFFRRGSNLE